MRVLDALQNVVDKLLPPRRRISYGKGNTTRFREVNFEIRVGQALTTLTKPPYVSSVSSLFDRVSENADN